MKMKKKLTIVAMLLAAALLLASCAGQNNGEKKLTTGDIEGTWTVSDKSVQSKEFLSLDGFILKPDTSAVLILRGGKITWEWEAQDGKHTSEAGAYEVNDGDVFFSSVRLFAKLEGRTLTLTQLIPEKLDELPADQPVMVEVTKKTVVILERK